MNRKAMADAALKKRVATLSTLCRKLKREAAEDRNRIRALEKWTELKLPTINSLRNRVERSDSE